jgi:hypothetical protein
MTDPDINPVVGEIEAFLRSYTGSAGLAPTDLYARPSGDDVDVIKVWVDLGTAGVGTDHAAWAAACEAAIRAAIPSSAPFRIQLHVEAGPPP